MSQMHFGSGSQDDDVLNATKKTVIPRRVRSDRLEGRTVVSLVMV